VIEKRAYQRSAIQAPLTFALKGKQEQTFQGLGRDISLGGMFIECSQPAAFGADVVVHVRLPGANRTFALPGRVRWVRDGGMGIQFGNLGAVETHTITEIARPKT
jgi:type IV pilus assembly protein PilZ